MGAQESAQVGVHRGDGQPAQRSPQVPDGAAATQGQQQVFCAHRKKQGVANRSHPAFGLRRQKDKDAARHIGQAGAGIDQPQYRLAAARAG